MPQLEEELEVLIGKGDLRQVALDKLCGMLSDFSTHDIIKLYLAACDLKKQGN